MSSSPMLARLLPAALVLLALGDTGTAALAIRPSSTTAVEMLRPVGPTGILLPAADPMASEMMLELRRGQQRYLRQLDALAQARNEAAAFAIQADMQRDRVGLQVALLRIQSSYAWRAGQERLADQLESTIRELVSPSDSPRSSGPRR